MTITREPVEPTKRGAMTPARRLRLWLAAGGRCGECRTKVPLQGTVMDHAIQLWMAGGDDDANLRPLCPDCDKPKTANDAKVRAKVKRLIRQADPATRKRSKRAIPRRPFQKQTKVWAKRSFPKRRPSP